MPSRISRPDRYCYQRFAQVVRHRWEVADLLRHTSPVATHTAHPMALRARVNGSTTTGIFPTWESIDSTHPKPTRKTAFQPYTRFLQAALHRRRNRVPLHRRVDHRSRIVRGWRTSLSWHSLHPAIPLVRGDAIHSTSTSRPRQDRAHPSRTGRPPAIEMQNDRTMAWVLVHCHNNRQDWFPSLRP